MRTAVKSSIYTTRQIARLVGVDTKRIRYFVRMGFVTPERGSRRQFLFSFGDILLLREARELIEAGISPRLVRKSLARLEEQLPGTSPLTSVHLRAEDGHVVAHGSSGKWRADSGQYLLTFPGESSKRPSQPEAAPVSIRSAALGEDADYWFERGFQTESQSVAEALSFYEKALAVDPQHFDAHLNRGRLLHEQGELAPAEAHYRAALMIQPTHVIANYNLGVVLEDSGRTREAVTAYEKALELDTYFREAHFNLARILDSIGDPTGALRHLNAYRKLGRP